MTTSTPDDDNQDAQPAVTADSTVRGELGKEGTALLQSTLDDITACRTMGVDVAASEDARLTEAIKDLLNLDEKIVKAIPDKPAFLVELRHMKEPNSLGLNEEGQLLIQDGREKAYSLGENKLQAEIRQTRVVYRGDDGETCVMTGEEAFTVTRRNEEGVPLEMELSPAAQGITPNSILMIKGLPTLRLVGDQEVPTGEFVQMDKSQFEKNTSTWAEDDSLDDPLLARIASGDENSGRVYSGVAASASQDADLGSLGVLRVNLNMRLAN